MGKNSWEIQQELSDCLSKEIYKQSERIEIEEKFNECFLDFNDFSGSSIKVKFIPLYTKFTWYKNRYAFTKEDLISNDFFDKFHLAFHIDIRNNEELIECLKMFSEYIDYDIEKTKLFNNYYDFNYTYSYTFKKRKAKKK